MKDFNWTAFTKKIAIKAPLSVIYNAFTIGREIETWFLEKAEFYTGDRVLYDAGTPVQAGVVYRWFWYLEDVPMTGVIKEANGKDYIQFTFEGECLVDIKLTEEQGYTIVELKHHNIPQDDQAKQFIRLGCSNGWHFYLINLKSVKEGGLDLRNKDRHLPAMINN